jgi:hypothetical protein
MRTLLAMFGFNTPTVAELELKLKNIMDLRAALITAADKACSDRIDTIATLNAELVALNTLKNKV